LPSRAEVRDLVARETAEQREAIAGGGNPHQVRLDQRDKIIAYAALLSPDDGLAFVEMHTEEVIAETRQIETDTARVLAQTAAFEAQQNAKALIIVAVVFTVIVAGVVALYVKFAT
jgi:CHASE3 domain sensor protein